MSVLQTGLYANAGRDATREVTLRLLCIDHVNRVIKTNIIHFKPAIYAEWDRVAQSEPKMLFLTISPDKRKAFLNEINKNKLNDYEINCPLSSNKPRLLIQQKEKNLR